MVEKKSLKKRIADWWNGEFRVWESPGVIGYHTERHWTSEIAHKIVDFYLAHWQWVWGTVIAVIGLLIAWRAL